MSAIPSILRYTYFAYFYILYNLLGRDLMTNIYFVRHAHSTYTPDEMERPLSEKGYLDALRVTELLIEEIISLHKNVV